MLAKTDIKRVNKFIKCAKNNLPLPDIQDLMLQNDNFPTIYKYYLNKYEAKNKTYTYLLTFTIDPKKWDLSEPVYDAIECFILKTLKRKGLKIKFSSIVREGSDVDHKHTHWHCAVATSACLKQDYFATYIKTYGNIDVAITKDKSLSLVDSLINKLDYMSKQIEPKILNNKILQKNHLKIAYKKNTKNWVRIEPKK